MVAPLAPPRPRRRSGAVLLALALSLAAGCGAPPDRPSAAPSPTSAPADGAASADGTRAPARGTGSPAPVTRERLRTADGTRRYLLRRPAGPSDGGRRPLVVAFHGRGADATHLRTQTGLDRDARARDLLVAYPEGLDRGWAAGDRPTRQRPDPDADVRFTEALVEHLVRTEHADPERVYAVGFSNGGSMALRVAADRPRLLAGAASVAGQLPTGDASVEPTGPVPVLIVHGAEDPVRPLAGLASPPPDPEEPILPTRSSRASAEAFAAAGDAGAPVTSAERGYQRTTWPFKGRPGGVQLLVVAGAGHTWPGSSLVPPQGFGATSDALDATATVLDFFSAAGSGRPDRQTGNAR
jgi:polyhydroxybutyrate depolymerase